MIEQVSVINGRNQGFIDAFLLAHAEPVGYAAHRDAVLQALSSLARRAKDAGGLRQDFTINDLVLVAHAGRALASLPASAREAAARRFATLVIDALRAHR